MTAVLSHLRDGQISNREINWKSKAYRFLDYLFGLCNIDLVPILTNPGHANAGIKNYSHESE